MFLENFFVRRQVRQFSFTTYYYTKPEDKEAEGDQPRIQFRQIRRGTRLEKKPVKTKVALFLLLLFFMYYFWGLVSEEARTFQLEEIRIEQAPSGY